MKHVSVIVVSALSVIAAAIHLAATPVHLAEWWVFGALFLLVAAGQGVFGVLVLQRVTQPLALAGIAGNAGIIVTYVLTRTIGLPIGPREGHVEDAGALDMAATVAEVGVIGALLLLLDGPYRRWTINLLLLVGAALWVLRLTGHLVGT